MKLSLTSLAIILLLFCSISSKSQFVVSTNGGSGLSTFYPSLQNAIVALNGVTITSPVVITCNPGNETAPSGGYTITAQGTATNTITIQGFGAGNSIITAPVPAGIAGSRIDGIFKLVGADYVTIKGFTMRENASNTNTTLASNTMLEWGVALLYASTTNGAQNNTIRDNIITLNKAWINSVGIYSNSTHAATTPSTNASATSPAGANNGLKAYGNNISNVNMGIVVVGATTAANMNAGVDIGGTQPSQGNFISDLGTNATINNNLNFFAIGNTCVAGVLVRNSTGINISYNNITSANSITGAMRAIYIPTFNSIPGNTTTAISNNTISLNPVTSSGYGGILVDFQTATTASAIAVNYNTFPSHGGGTYISVGMSNLNTDIIGNNFSHTSGLGSFSFINLNFAIPENGNLNVSNNVGAGNSGGGTCVSKSLGASGASSQNFTNNDFSNLTSPVTANGIRLTGANPYSTVTITGNNLSNWNTVGATTALYVESFGAGNSNISNNIIDNINVTGGTMTGIYLGAGDNAATSVDIKNNRLSNFTASSNITGIHSLNSSPNILIESNNIYALATTYSGAALVSITGIHMAAASTTTISKNKINNLSAPGSGPMISGLLLAGGTTINVFNNLIGSFTAPAGHNVAGTDLIRGINITSTTVSSILNIAFNTVYLNATGGATFSTSGIYQTCNALATTASLILRNNIICNLSSPGNGYTSAFRRSAATNLNNYSSLSNANAFHAGIPSARNLLFYNGTSGDQTIQAYKSRMYPADDVSVTEAPQFISVDGNNGQFLRITPFVLTQLESAGTPLPEINTDYDYESRNNPPDIGADEFTGIQIDETGPRISYQPLINTTSPAARTLTAYFSDTSGIPVSGTGLPMLYWKRGSGSYSGVQAVYVSDSTYTFTFGAGVGGDTIYYYIAAQDNLANVSVKQGMGIGPTTANPPATSAPPSAPSFYYISAAFSGDINVGTSETITSLTNTNGLFDRINKGVLTGNLVVHIKSNITNELGLIALNQWGEEGPGGYSLTIKPDGQYLIRGSASIGAIIKINGADRVTIDGSKDGTNSKDLSFYQNMGAGNIATIWIASAGTGQGAHHVTIKNCNIPGGHNFAFPTNENYVIYAGGATVSSTSTGDDNDNLTIVNNNISKAYGGIYVGASTSGINDSLVISGNTIGTTSDTSAIALWGIYVRGASNASITKNIIRNIRGTQTGIPAGIKIGAGTVDTKISGNNISGVFAVHNFSAGASGIDVNTAATTSNIEISNNMISNIKGAHEAGDFYDGNFGIRLYSAVPMSGFNIYYNSVSIDSTSVPATTNPGRSAAIFVGATCTNLDVRNNIFANSINSTFGSAESYAILSLAPQAAYNIINYNNYYAEGTQAKLGFLTTVRTTLAAWKTATAQDVNSVNIKPVFTAANDLHLVPELNIATDMKAIPLAGFTTDIDNDLRNPNYPIMGADEYGYYLFNGNGDWGTAANWLNNAVAPTLVPPGTEVVIDPSGQCIQTGNLATQAGAKISVKPGKTLNLNGDLDNAGTVTGAGVLNLASGTSNLTSTGTLTTTMLLSSKKLVLNSNLDAGAIMLTNKSRIELGSFDLVMDTFALVGNDTNFVVTNGTGRVSKTIGTTPVKLHIGVDSNSYTPVTISNVGTPGDFKVKVITGTNHPSVSSNHTVDRTWVIDTTAPGAKISVTMQWNQAEENVSFNRGNAYISQSHSCPAPPNCVDSYFDVAQRTSATSTGTGSFTMKRDSVTNPTKFIIRSGFDTSTFTGNGSWHDPNNWTIGIVPPDSIPNGREIIINHPPGGECVFTGDLTVKKGAKLTVLPGRRLRVTGRLFIEE